MRETKTPNHEKEDHGPKMPPKTGQTSLGSLRLPSGELKYSATADWMRIKKKDRPIAEIFYVSYFREPPAPKERPVTFVFNGGPGAASAFLHVGALGPHRVLFDENGTVPPPPARLVENLESWLPWTDLVFVDPVGTGFSRMIEAPEGASAPSADARSASLKADTGKDAVSDDEFFQLKKDISSLGEFIERFLSRFHRWSSPIFIAGESYGGFRVGKLARSLQEENGIGLSGVILISPAMEWGALDPSDYNIGHWIDTFPAMAAAAHFHGRAGRGARDLAETLTKAEAFATRRLPPLLTLGEALPEGERADILREYREFLGLDENVVGPAGGRLTIQRFCRELLRGSRQICGLYDATIVGHDPFPDREISHAPDPTLFAIDRIFATGVNIQIRDHIGLDVDRLYTLLNLEVNRNWKVDTGAHAFQRQVGSTDDLRYAMSLNPDMRVLITHGFYDLVTPYFTSTRLVHQMKLLPEQRERIVLVNFQGGHMFYTWEKSRIEFATLAQSFYRGAIGGRL